MRKTLLMASICAVLGFVSPVLSASFQVAIDEYDCGGCGGTGETTECVGGTGSCAGQSSTHKVTCDACCDGSNCKALKPA
jgi:hypothetical protein